MPVDRGDETMGRDDGVEAGPRTSPPPHTLAPRSLDPNAPALGSLAPRSLAPNAPAPDSLAPDSPGPGAIGQNAAAFRERGLRLTRLGAGALRARLAGLASRLGDLPTFARRIVHNDWFEGFIIFCVIVNAAIIGFDAQLSDAHPFHNPARTLDLVFLLIFTAELGLKLLAFGVPGFFRKGWNLFDLVIVAASWSNVVPALSALRVLRVLRVLRLLHVVPQMRRIIESLNGAIPGIAATLAVLFVVFFIGSVMATTLYGDLWPERFGTLSVSALTLFQLTLFDNWGDIVFTVMNDKGAPTAWIFFIIFTFLSAFAVMNLFIGVIVEAVQQSQTRIVSEKIGEVGGELREVGAELGAVEADMESLASAQMAAETIAAQREQRMAEELAAIRSEIAALRVALAAPK